MAEIQAATEATDGRLYIAIPPRHGKSELVSVRLPAWYLGKNPAARVIHASYTSDLSNEFSRQVRALVRDDARYRAIFPEMQLDSERKRITDFRTTAGGSFRSVGVGSGITGHGADLLIIDDPHKEGDAESLAVLDGVYNWYVSAARTRLAPGASIVFIMTRWHQLDLAGRLLSLRDSDHWKAITLPALAGADDLLGRLPGAALWPEQYSVAALERIRGHDGQRFEALYQNDPRGVSALAMEYDDFRLGAIPDIGIAFMTVDLAVSEREEADYTVIARWLWHAGDVHLLDYARFRAQFPVARERILAWAERYADDRLYFPEDPLERPMMQLLRRDLGRHRLQGHKIKGDKREKAAPLAVLVADGRFYTHAEGGRDNDFINELCQFPQGRFDDCVDAAALAVDVINSKPGVFAMSNLEYEPEPEINPDWLKPFYDPAWGISPAEWLEAVKKHRSRDRRARHGL